MDTKEDKATEPRIDVTAAEPRQAQITPLGIEVIKRINALEASGEAVDDSTLERVAAEVKAEQAPFEPGDCGFITTTLSKPDGTKAEALTYVRVLAVEGGRYRVSLGRGLTTLCGPPHMKRVPPGGIGGRVLFTIGDVVEIPLAAPSDAAGRRQIETPCGVAETISGTPIGDHTELKPNGQQKDYLVLTAEERAKGFVEPVRRSYRHDKCGAVTTMSDELAETYARCPDFYSGTFCTTCRNHFPVGETGEFTWAGTTQKVGTRALTASSPPTEGGTTS